MSSFRLIVAEKPSVARDIARVLGVRQRGEGYLEGDGTRVTWCVGHLVELSEPMAYDPRFKSWNMDLLPIMPEVFTLQARKGASDQWKVVRALLRDSDLEKVVNACDAGREGELIFTYAYQLAACRAPVERLWISSMTDTAIKAGFRSLQPGERFAALADAARCRSEADWLVGLNATRAMTVCLRSSAGGGAVLSLGRVQTPTLALLVEREDAIEAFTPQDFWEVRARLAVEAGAWEATWFQRVDDGRREERIWKEADAQEVRGRIQRAGAGVVSDLQQREKREPAPLLYDLTSLQREANRRFGLTAQQTLDVAQALYERHKVLTYPRTDARHLGTDQVPGLEALVKSLDFGPYQQAAGDVLQRWPVVLGDRVVDDAEVSDHHAIIPTGVDPRGCGLSAPEKRVYDLVARRFLAVFMPEAIFATTVLEVDVAGDPLLARGRTCLAPGWYAIDPPANPAKQVSLPLVEKGQEVLVAQVWLHEGRTQPPKRYNDASLLTAMERAGEAMDEDELKRALKRKGLGTPATRAAVIETLLQRGYAMRQAPHVLATPLGRALLGALPVADLRSARLTGEWESRLAAMADGQEDRAHFMKDIRAFTVAAVEGIRAMEPTAQLRELLAASESKEIGEILGDCPLCGAQVGASRRGWRCQKCSLYIPQEVARRKLSARMASQLLTRRETAVVKGFRSKANKEFSAALRLSDEGKVVFHFPEPEALGPCPVCEKPVRLRGPVFTCDTGRACRFVLFAETQGAVVTEEAVREMLRQGRSPVIEGFKGKDDETWSGTLSWDGQRVAVRRFDEREAAGVVGPCVRCGAGVMFQGGRWRCQACAFAIPAAMARRDLRPQEVADLLTGGRTERLHGFRQSGGAVFKAALVLQPDGSLSFDYSKPAAEAPRPLPPGAVPPAFGSPHLCPLCRDGAEPDPGYVIAGHKAWGCSRWRQGCRLQIPFIVEGLVLPEEEVQRLLGRHRATCYISGFGGSETKGRRKRLVIDPEQAGGWRLEARD